MLLLRFETQNQIGIVRYALRQLRGAELGCVDAGGVQQRLAGRVDGMSHQTMGAGAVDFKRGSLRVSAEKIFSHWRSADIAGAYEQDAHVQTPQAYMKK